MKTVTLGKFASGHVSKADVLDFVKDKLLEQGKVSYDGNCMYNGPEGTHCAIGHMLTAKQQDVINYDNIHSQIDINSSPVGDIIDLFDIKISSNKLEFLKDLQTVHDSLFKVTEEKEFKQGIKQNIKSLAKQYKV
jgi:hypothetical protein